MGGLGIEKSEDTILAYQFGVIRVWGIGGKRGWNVEGFGRQGGKFEGRLRYGV